MFCQTHTQKFEISNVKGVRGFKRGHHGLNVEYGHFDIMMYFRDETPEKRLLDTSSAVKCSQTVKLINEFLGTHLDMIYPEQKKQLFQNEVFQEEFLGKDFRGARKGRRAKVDEVYNNCRIIDETTGLFR